MEFEKWGVSRPLPVAEGGRRTSSSDLEFWTERSEGTKYLSRNRKNKKKEQDKFAAWSNQIKAAQPIAASYSAPFVGVGESTRTGIERTQPTQPIKSQPEIKTPPAPRRGGITLHPGMEEVDQKAKESAAAKEISSERELQPQARAPFIPVGQAERIGEPTPPKPFTFSQSPKAEIPANRFSAYDATLLPGFETRTGMPFIPPSVGTAYDNPLEATPFGAYTNIWDIEEAAPPVPSVFATMDDETLSQLITAYSDKMKKLNLQGLLESGEKSYGERTLDQLVLGNYSDDATLLGTAAQVGLGIAGLDLPMDIRDITYDITNWEWTPEHIAQTLLDAVGFIPVIGSLKYADEFADVLKSADEIADIAKRAPELVELARDMSKLDDVLGSADEFGELLESAPEMTDLLKNTDKAAELFDGADEFTSGAGDIGKIPWDSWQNYEKVTANGQEYAKVGDRLYSRHAVDRMQPSGKKFTVGDAIVQAGGVSGRSVAPQYVEDVIRCVKPVFQPATCNYIYSSGTVKIVTNEYGYIVTIMTVG